MNKYKTPTLTSDVLRVLLTELEEEANSDISSIHVSSSLLSQIPTERRGVTEVAHWVMEDEMVVEMDSGKVLVIMERRTDDE